MIILDPKECLFLNSNTVRAFVRSLNKVVKLCADGSLNFIEARFENLIIRPTIRQGSKSQF